MPWATCVRVYSASASLVTVSNSPHRPGCHTGRAGPPRRGGTCLLVDGMVSGVGWWWSWGGGLIGVGGAGVGALELVGRRVVGLVVGVEVEQAGLFDGALPVALDRGRGHRRRGTHSRGVDYDAGRKPKAIAAGPEPAMGAVSLRDP